MFAAHPDRRAYYRDWSWPALAAGLLGFGPPAQDPMGAAARTLGAPGVWQFGLGRILDAVPGAQAYRVSCEDGRPVLAATPLGFGGVAGPLVHQALPVGAVVWLALPPGRAYALIVGVLPPEGAQTPRRLRDEVFAASRIGLDVDGLHQAAARIEGRVPYWGAGRPHDLTTLESGQYLAGGGRLTLSEAMLQLAMDEATGFWAFRDLDLARLAGPNLQIRSAGHEDEFWLDQNEFSRVAGLTLYPWEQLGVLERAFDPFWDPEVDGSDHLSALEPQFEDQVPFHRLLTYAGYLGQGAWDLVQAPPQTGTAYFRCAPEQVPAVGLYAQTRSLAGTTLTRAATGSYTVKTPSIVVPRRVRRPDDPTGDTPETYAFAGLDAEGQPVHKPLVRPRDPEDAPCPHVQLVLALPDLLAAAEWDAELGFHYHGRDWALPEDGEGPLGALEPLDLLAAADQYFLPRPAPREVWVDHRQPAVEVFPNRSVIAQTPDGGIVLQDGYGSALRMVGGMIYLEPAKDLVVRTGRSMVVLAGRDVCVRAHDHCELSAATGSVRVKAEEHVQVLAGNGERNGALLLECRTAGNLGYLGVVGDDVQAGGIQIRSAGEIAAWATGLYLQGQSGGIVLEAAGPIVHRAEAVARYSRTGYYDYFESEGVVDAANQYTAQVTRLAGPLVVDGGGYFTQGGLTVRGQLSVLGGHVATEQSSLFNGLVGTFNREALDAMRAETQNQVGLFDDLRAAGQSSWDGTFGTFLGGEGRPGDPVTAEAVRFSFRDDAQYRVDGFLLPEASWQRALPAAAATWTEPGVLAGGRVTYPYPGARAWSQEPSWLQQPSTLYDEDMGRKRPRDPAVYQDARLAEPVRTVPDGRYTLPRGQ